MDFFELFGSVPVFGFSLQLVVWFEGLLGPDVKGPDVEGPDGKGPDVEGGRNLQRSMTQVIWRAAEK